MAVALKRVNLALSRCSKRILIKVAAGFNEVTPLLLRCAELREPGSSRLLCNFMEHLADSYSVLRLQMLLQILSHIRPSSVCPLVRGRLVMRKFVGRTGLSHQH